MNIKIPDYFPGFQTHSSTALQQAQKAQEAAMKNMEDTKKNNQDNIYQQQADQIREERDLHEIDQELANEEKKLAKKEAQDKLEDEMQHLSNVFDPETAKQMLSSNLLLKSALQADGEASDAGSVLEASGDLTLNDQTDALKEAASDISSDLSDPVNTNSLVSPDKIVISDATLTQQRKMVTDLYQSGNVLP